MALCGQSLYRTLQVWRLPAAKRYRCYAAGVCRLHCDLVRAVQDGCAVVRADGQGVYQRSFLEGGRGWCPGLFPTFHMLFSVRLRK